MVEWRWFLKKITIKRKMRSSRKPYKNKKANRRGSPGNNKKKCQEQQKPWRKPNNS